MASVLGWIPVCFQRISCYRLFLALCFLCSLLQGILASSEDDVSYDVHLGPTQALNPEFDGKWTTPLSGKGLEKVIRLRILGLSRAKNFTRFAHVAHLSLNVQKAREQAKHGKIHVCLHWNESTALGECKGTSSWKLVEGKLWTATVSPFDTHFLDVKVETSSDLGAITVEEEFQPHQVAFLLAGLALLAMAPAMAACVPLYYSSAMALSIIAVVLIILYQSTKLLPVGRKRAMNMLIFGSLVGLTSVIVSYFETALSKFAALFGMKGGNMQPVVIFAVIFVFIVGAGLGFWAVRKFVLGPDGKPNSATTNFVSASIRAIAFGMLLLSSIDYVFRQLALAIGVAIVLLSRWGWLLPVTALPRWRPKTPLITHMDERVVMDDNNPVSPATPSTKLDLATPKVQSKRRLLDSPAPAAVLTPPAGTYVSSYYKTPARKPMTEDEYEESGQEHTAKGLVELMQSPNFAEWARANADRLRAEPLKGEENPRGDISIKDVYKRNAGKCDVDYPSSEEEEGAEGPETKNTED